MRFGQDLAEISTSELSGWLFLRFLGAFFQTQLDSDPQINQAVSLQPLKQSGTYYISPESYM